MSSVYYVVLKLQVLKISPTLYTGSVKLKDLFYFTASTELSTAVASGAGCPCWQRPPRDPRAHHGPPRPSPTHHMLWGYLGCPRYAQFGR